MNSVSLVGNLARDPELRQSQSGVAVCLFTVAVSRRIANKDGVREADFIDCVAFRQTAEFVCKWFQKGRKIGINGSLQTRSYEAKDGSKRYVTEVIVDNAEFVDSAKNGETGAKSAPAASEPTAANGYTPMTEVDNDDLPF